MATFVALLRGVNVGGHQKLTSADLREACERAGFTSVRTYLQSGNALFRTNARSTPRVIAAMRAALQQVTGMDVAILLRTPAELETLIERNPYADAARQQPSRLLIVFLAEEPPRAVKATVEKYRAPSEQIEFSGRELFAWFPDGAGRSKLAAALTPAKLGVECTARNWNTVVALLELASSDRDDDGARM